MLDRIALHVSYLSFCHFTGKPPAFACHRTTPHTGVGIITYTICNVKTQGMDASSGKFSVDVSTFKYSMTIRKLYVVYWYFEYPVDVSILSIWVHPSQTQVPGVYHLSFTGLFHAENGHGVHADIVRITSTGKTEYLGRSSADSNEVSTFFSTGRLPYQAFIIFQSFFLN